jgi:hypothetical protein
MIDLELGHEELRKATRLLETNAEWVVDLDEIAKQLKHAFVKLYVVFDQLEDPIPALRAAIGSIDAVVGLLGSTDNTALMAVREGLLRARPHLSSPVTDS